MSPENKNNVYLAAQLAEDQGNVLPYANKSGTVKKVGNCHIREVVPGRKDTFTVTIQGDRIPFIAYKEIVK